MKRLYLMRHAKSTWECGWLDDVERPLNERGKRDAPAMGIVMKQLGYVPDTIITSPAARAYSTARIVAEEIGFDLSQIQVREDLYDGTTKHIQVVIESIDNAFASAILFGHNPGFTSTANRLTGAGIDNVPTAGLVAIDFPVKKWRDVWSTPGELISFEFPKKDGRAIPEND